MTGATPLAASPKGCLAPGRRPACRCCEADRALPSPAPLIGSPVRSASIRSTRPKRRRVSAGPRWPSRPGRERPGTPTLLGKS